MRDLITLVNDNRVDNYLKEILAFVYYGSIVNNRLDQLQTFEQRLYRCEAYKG